ncbi:MAG: ankyrin repeat domain-containing protein [Desulfomonilaceae bacterium]|nr:ankyrin repeat domain-containing protein [Desulfomonilaceae bacterium]
MMRKRAPLVGVLVLSVLFGGFAWAQVVGGVDPFRIGLSEEALYLQPDDYVKGRYTLMWSAWIVVDARTTTPIRLVGECSLAPLGQWTMAPSSRFSLEKLRPGINAIHQTFPLASIDLPPDSHAGSSNETFPALFDYNQAVKVRLSLRRQGYWAGYPPLAENHYDLRPLGYALLAAAGSGNVGVVRDLLDKGADPDSATVQNWTALMEAASRGRSAVVKALLDHGARVNLRRKGFPFVLSQLGSAIPYGETALMSACSAGDPETVRLLLNAGARVNVERMDKWNALLAASYSGHAEVVSMLLAKGAKIDSSSELGYSAAALADINGNAGAWRLLRERGDSIRVPWDVLSQSR